MYGNIGNPERLTLGSSSCRLERGGSCKRIHHTQKGRFLQTKVERTRLEGIRRGARDPDRVTKHLIGAGERAGGSASSTEAGER